MRSIFFAVLGLSSIVYIFTKVKKRLFAEKESFHWMVAGIFVLILSIFPRLIDKIALFFGIEYPPSFLFLISILFITFMIFRITQHISLLNERVKELAQRNAILEEQIRTMSKK